MYIHVLCKVLKCYMHIRANQPNEMAACVFIKYFHPHSSLKGPTQMMLVAVMQSLVLRYIIEPIEIPYSGKCSYGANFRIFRMLAVHTKLKIAKF